MINNQINFFAFANRVFFRPLSEAWLFASVARTRVGEVTYAVAVYQLISSQYFDSISQNIEIIRSNY